MILENKHNIYNSHYDFISDLKELKQVQNKLFCTFTPPNQLEQLISLIKEKYTILYNKIFVFSVLGYEELVCTYNVEQGNIDYIIEGTISVHRKKETNSLYTINALNELIKKLNNGKEDSSFKINWFDYKNSILLTQNNNLKELKTKIYKIIVLD